ncbi:tubulin epsilon chain [Raphidocelis subcapitata]|uniref:Tubulin epsilon chain n=1 Tax=Raphidocelis subcapitata TaxID=307507 RepID=A0A2V0P9G5_9CHLO|nr:tubulin epsilon chain [Raphidocelis subcapitata]|eukprot:GBF94543.1 tubulin epsilon chain [Raphidocelis subcapitata]
MPREIVTIQVGQCGNQIGCRFWEMALREHAAYNPDGVYDAALSSFFRNVDTRFEPPLNLPVGAGGCRIRGLKARAVVVDTEEGVVNKMARGPLAEVLDRGQLLYDVSGAGNNWAHGHHGYGPRYRDALSARLRRAAEGCDSLQSFLLLHSLGGGTGSGLGTYILGLLQDEYPGVFRFSAPVFPSEDDHVVTAPYNALLAAAELARGADCVLPVENQALADVCARGEQRGSAAGGGGGGGAQAGGGGGGGGGGASGNLPWDAMNGVAASMLLHLTAGVRFEGSLNVDLNDITSNLLFTDAFSRDHQLIWAEPRAHTFLATALLLRGGAGVGDAQRNVARLRRGLRFAHWNQEGFKIGLCSQPPVGLPHSLLALSNNCCVTDTLGALQARFGKLYKRRLFLHHYLEYMEPAGFDEAAEAVAAVAEDYRAADGARPGPVARLRPRGLGFV